jgi:fumarate reductase flavoprotein subunit
MEKDVVVVGSGVAGFAAALTAAEGGASVVVLEKQPSLGGTSNFFEGIFAVESEMQRERYITYSRDEAFKNIMEYSHWKANARLVRAFVDESAGTISWLKRQGVEFSDVTINMPYAPRTYHVVKGTGAAVVRTLATKARERAVEILVSTAGKRILKTGGIVQGVVADSDGEEFEIRARAVVVASGGYANNADWIRKYAGFDLGVNIFPVGNVGKMGDGIRMALEAGAADEGLGVLEVFRVGPFGPDYPLKNHIEMVAVQPLLWVSPKGERFCDEGIAFYDTSVGNANARFKEGYSYSLFDDAIVQHYLEHGIDRNVGIDNLPGTRPRNFYRELEAVLSRDQRDVFAADTLEELASKTGMDANLLKATVEEYNHFCEKGHDDLFAKERRYLIPVKGPRYYAVKAKTVFLGTLGGIKINHRAEVIDKNGRVIPGLYAAGYDAGGMWGDSYCIRHSSGASAGFAINSGRIAGKSLLRYLGKAP